MKNLMVSHVENHRNSMFRNATNVVQRQLEDELCKRIQADLEAHVRDLQARLARDYLSVLVGVDVASFGLGPSRVELMLRAEMAPLLTKTDGVFAELFEDKNEDTEKGDAASVSGERDDSPVQSEQDLAADDSITVKGEGD
jgi:hypothetical protein